MAVGVVVVVVVLVVASLLNEMKSANKNIHKLNKINCWERLLKAHFPNPLHPYYYYYLYFFSLRVCVCLCVLFPKSTSPLSTLNWSTLVSLLVLRLCAFLLLLLLPIVTKTLHAAHATNIALAAAAAALRYCMTPPAARQHLRELQKIK